MRKKVLDYVLTCWYDSRCYKKEDILKIIDQVISENPDETRITKLGLLSKRRCIGELQKWNSTMQN